MDKPSRGSRATPPGKFFGPVLCRKRNLVIRVFLVVMFLESEKNTVAALCNFPNNSEISITPWT